MNSAQTEFSPPVMQDKLLAHLGLLWVPRLFSYNTYTFYSANRFPDRLAEGSGYLGFNDWRIPSTGELQALFDALSEPSLPIPTRKVSITLTAGGVPIWTSTGEDGQAWAFDCWARKPFISDPSVRRRIMIVRSADG